MPSYKRESGGQSIKFYQQDIVKKTSSPEWVGIILRCWHEAEEDMPPEEVDPQFAPLKPGEVGVSFLSRGGKRETLPQSELTLVDRTFQPGDLCKRSIDDFQSGIITTLKVKGHLEHTISRVPVDGWKSAEDMIQKAEPVMGDYVIYDDWIGQVVETFEEVVIQTESGEMVCTPDIGARMCVGEKGSHLLLASSLESGAVPAGKDGDTVVAIRPYAYAIAWLAINQTLDPTALEQKPRPARFWIDDDFKKLTLIKMDSDLEVRLGDRVRLKEPPAIKPTQHGRSGESQGLINVDTFLVVETETNVGVLWQDGTTEVLKANELVPYLNPDEHDCWPGEFVFWNTDGEKKLAIVQSVNAEHRTAMLRLADTAGGFELASLLELDVHGSSDANPALATVQSFGVHRGDFVFTHREGTNNGTAMPWLPKIGEVQPWVKEDPFAQHDGGWRHELWDLGTALSKKRAEKRDWTQRFLTLVPKQSKQLQWCGEVVHLNLDGTVDVVHPDYTKETYPIERLTRLYDGVEQYEDGMLDDEASDGMHEDAEEDLTWTMGEDGRWQVEMAEDREDWEDVDEIGAEGDDMAIDEEQGDTMDGRETEAPATLAAPGETSEEEVPEDHQIAEDDDHWKRFEVLPTAPVDHAFYSSPAGQRPKAFLTRLHREYKALSSSLPDTILVRAFEDRTDLLRTLIVGPENTPYEDAPFVIDWLLDANFPQSPPIAHFLSWTNSNGRVNPNLYEDGKVCLSILGTWSGDKNEIWSAARSTLLQVFLSIQGLVLVKEPWFCEPAYEKLRGTKEGTVNSRLYSERAYVLSRGFVRRALELPLGSLEDDIKYFYYTRKRLDKVIRHARDLITKSKEPEPEGEFVASDLAVPRLTEGGIIMLERTLAKLVSLRSSST